LEVQTEQAPSERWRTPEWFTPDVAKLKLAAGRSAFLAWSLTDLIEQAMVTLGCDEDPSW
jgi:hypothetical protein